MCSWTTRGRKNEHDSLGVGARHRRMAEREGAEGGYHSQGDRQREAAEVGAQWSPAYLKSHVGAPPRLRRDVSHCLLLQPTEQKRCCQLRWHGPTVLPKTLLVRACFARRAWRQAAREAPGAWYTHAML